MTTLCFEAANGGISLNGAPFFFKGASYFGMESDICVPHGLWGGDASTTLADVAQILRSNGFNLVRLPLAVSAVVNNTLVDRNKIGNEKALLKSFQWKDLRYFDVLDYMVHEFQRFDLLVLLDAHVMHPGGDITPLCCDAGHEIPCFWGENFQAAGKYPVSLEVKQRLVYCPHVYGPAVAWQPYFNADDFPENMTFVWDTHFGLLKQRTDVPLVIGEWGGQHANPKDWQWQKRFAEYAQQIGVSGVVYWCVNPNGGDTDGLLCDDWRTPNTEAFQLLSCFTGTPLPPHPSC
ncbi:hypothetical protein BBO99_00005784 [Phytophthora kernoviae]|uniref:Glycoside hydrolase family 5 domain-containing protein n=2 Tax=Phytophthora kernoviae TaxID=325452 RepID=A0A3R7JYC8_9STRA|nr:hypothetical protein G195_006417 [Phytophthora kernoviae 00238/432]KAG2524910.1 hypothetical protein JM18_005178 [Phytophthora kernoviae]RLN36572.1 hypothetical protein BBI17_005815 [Phytophthora kernoviae]RLN78707.1 hypothetical protein BBO99_00005784 [Phytophthora kernoviae]